MRVTLLTLLVCVLLQACATDHTRRTDTCFTGTDSCPKNTWFDLYDEKGRYVQKSIYYTIGDRDTTIEVYPFPTRHMPIRSFANQMFFGKAVCLNKPGTYEYFTWSVGKGTLVESNIVQDTWSGSPRTASTTDCFGRRRLTDVGVLVPEEILQSVWAEYAPLKDD